MSCVIRTIIFLLCAFITTTFAAAQSWQSWVAQLRVEAIQQGIRPALFDRIFADIPAPHAQVMSLDRSQPEKRLTFLQYRQSRIDPYRIKIGRAKYQQYYAILNKISHDYGVNGCIVTALWGIESSYGTYLGTFPVIRSLATLAYDSRRGQFFRQELLYALQIVNEGHISVEDFKGEWAGASGHPQFLPSSWHKYAVDYDGDGKRDIWKSQIDVFASIANYLQQNGWQAGEPWGVMVTAPATINPTWLGRKNFQPVSFWLSHGVQVPSSVVLPHNTPAALVALNGGSYVLIFNNFNVLMRYNASTFYAASVGYLADQICAGRQNQKM